MKKKKRGCFAASPLLSARYAPHLFAPLQKSKEFSFIPFGKAREESTGENEKQKKKKT